MTELPFWRLRMRRREQEGRWADFAATQQTLLDEVRTQLRLRGSPGNRDFVGQRVNNYRGGKDTALAFYYLCPRGREGRPIVASKCYLMRFSCLFQKAPPL